METLTFLSVYGEKKFNISKHFQERYNERFPEVYYTDFAKHISQVLQKSKVVINPDNRADIFFVRKDKIIVMCRDTLVTIIRSSTSPWHRDNGHDWDQWPLFSSVYGKYDIVPTTFSRIIQETELLEWEEELKAG